VTGTASSDSVGHAVTVTPVTLSTPPLTSANASDRGSDTRRVLVFPHSLYLTASLWACMRPPKSTLRVVQKGVVTQLVTQSGRTKD
jgi:hypothetical protein